MAIGTLAAIGIAGAVGGSILGAKSNQKAASTAANAQTQNTASNNALASNIYSQNAAALSPYQARGGVAGDYLQGLYGLPQGNTGGARDAFANYIANSDYGFKFGTGTNALNSGYAAQGTLQSGAAMKGLEQFRQNLQSGYRNEFANGLDNQQAVGLGAASAQAGVGQNYVNTVSANNNTAADAMSNAALIKGQNNPFANALGIMGGAAFGMAR